MTRWRRLVPFSILLAWSGTAPAAASNEEKQEARRLAYGAQAAYEAGDFAAAHEQASRGYVLVAAPTLALLDARALRRLNRWLEARERYQSAAAPLERSAPAAFQRARAAAIEELAVLEGLLPKLLLALDRAPQMQVELVVELDGVRIPDSELGVVRALDPGPHTVSYQVGERRERRNFEMVPGQFERILIETGVTEQSSPALELEDESGGASGWKPIVGLGAVGVGALGLTVGVVQGLRALNMKSSLDEQCSADQCPPGSSGDISEYRRTRDSSTIGYIVGAASLTAGGLLLWDASGDDDGLSAGVGAGNAWIRGVF